MKRPQQFRPGDDFKITESAAAHKPLSSGDKVQDKQRTEEIATHIAELQDLLYAERRRKVLVVLQGMDTSGKDGTVRGVFGRIDPLGVFSVAFKAPTPQEKAHDYLWRVHKQVPGAGEIVIFNRSHYEDVLVPKVHGWIDQKECRRRYAHIRDFERMLAETGTTVLKFFLHISKQEQKVRLEERLADPAKHWKFDPQDLAERAYWDAYRKQYAAVIAETDADHAPWYVIPSDSKTHRNLAIAQTVLETLQSMTLVSPPANPDFAKLKVE